MQGKDTCLLDVLLKTLVMLEFLSLEAIDVAEDEDRDSCGVTERVRRSVGLLLSASKIPMFIPPTFVVKNPHACGIKITNTIN